MLGNGLDPAARAPGIALVGGFVGRPAAAAVAAVAAGRATRVSLEGEFLPTRARPTRVFAGMGSGLALRCTRTRPLLRSLIRSARASIASSPVSVAGEASAAAVAAPLAVDFGVNTDLAGGAAALAEVDVVGGAGISAAKGAFIAVAVRASLGSLDSLGFLGMAKFSTDFCSCDAGRFGPGDISEVVALAGTDSVVVAGLGL